MFKLNNGAVPYYTVPIFEETGLVRHGFTTRMGGVSGGYYSSMNLCYNCDDDKENVSANFKLAANSMGMNYDRLVLSKQVHETEIAEITAADCGNGILYENKFRSADGLITAEHGIGLITLYADCVPLIFLDKKQGIIATSHSGWKGTVGRIAEKTVRKMTDKYNSKCEDILCAVGPSIQECHFEVGDDVAERFINEFGADTAVKYGNRYHVNMQRAILKQLAENGIKDENTAVSGMCTYCMSDTFFSHRKTGGKRGNFGAFIELI